MKVYLAGKIREHERDWRRDIVDNVATYDNGLGGNPYLPTIGRYRQWEGDDNQGATGIDRWTWPVRASTIPGVDITGPFFIEGEGHDGMHGPGLHGMGEYGNWYGQPLGTERGFKTTQLCRAAINASDLVYVWLGPQPHRPGYSGAPGGWESAYGTIFEMGFAAALGKAIAMAWEPEEPAIQTELWFPLYHAKAALVADNAKEGLLKVIDALKPKPGLELCESPPEKSLFRAAQGGTLKLTPQHKVGRYRLDFAIVDKKVAIEVDGLTYHNGQESFIRDQQRQRDLQAAGWQVIRFAAKEALDNPQRCLAETERLIP